ncbi:MAG: hypothetical protein ACON5H_05395 [Akkermansiaceae bacterium]
MKRILLTATCLMASLGFAELRTWTSATDASKTFEAEFKSSDGKTVTVLRNRRIQKFKITLLSKEDQEWVEAEMAKGDEKVGSSGMTSSEFAKTDFGKALKKVKKINGKKYAKSGIEEVPKFFILYFSASW